MNETLRRMREAIEENPFAYSFSQVALATGASRDGMISVAARLVRNGCNVKEATQRAKLVALELNIDDKEDEE